MICLARSHPEKDTIENAIKIRKIIVKTFVFIFRFLSEMRIVLIDPTPTARVL